jgi:hypothetical protein
VSAHEAPLREWQRVKEWLTENREFLRMRDRLDLSPKLWLSRGKQKDDLSNRDSTLAEGEKLVKDFDPRLAENRLITSRRASRSKNDANRPTSAFVTR